MDSFSKLLVLSAELSVRGNVLVAQEQNQLELFVEARRGLTRELLYYAQAGERGGAFGSRWVLFSGPYGISAPVGEYESIQEDGRAQT